MIAQKEARGMLVDMCLDALDEFRPQAHDNATREDISNWLEKWIAGYFEPVREDYSTEIRICPGASDCGIADCAHYHEHEETSGCYSVCCLNGYQTCKTVKVPVIVGD